MAVPVSLPSPLEAVRDHDFHPLRVARVIDETADARSFVLDVPEDLRAAFGYEAGQFCTFRAWIDGEPHHRCYSMCSTPGVDAELQVTVKRVPGGLVSNWMNDTLEAGDEIEATYPAGVFRLVAGRRRPRGLRRGERDHPGLLAGQGRAWPTRAAGSTSSTPTATGTARSSRPSSTPWPTGTPAGSSSCTTSTSTRGFVDAGAVAPFAWVGDDPDFYLCGPTPFMDIVERSLLGQGMAPDRIHIERFARAGAGRRARCAVGRRRRPGSPSSSAGRTETGDHHPGTTILQTARQLGMAAPVLVRGGQLRHLHGAGSSRGR